MSGQGTDGGCSIVGTWAVALLAPTAVPLAVTVRHYYRTGGVYVMDLDGPMLVLLTAACWGIAHIILVRVVQRWCVSGRRRTYLLIWCWLNAFPGLAGLLLIALGIVALVASL